MAIPAGSGGRWHRYLILFFVLILAVSCRATGVRQVSEFPEQQSFLPAAVTFVNWNAHKMGNPAFSRDLATLLDEEQPDLMFLQETRPDTGKTPAMGGYFAGNWKFPRVGGAVSGITTLSTIAPMSAYSLPTRYREFFVTFPKVSLITEHMLSNGESLLAVNVHLLNFERWGTAKLDSQLKNLEEAMRGHPGPVILAGDFNTWNNKRLARVLEIAKSLKLEEVTGFPPRPDYSRSAVRFLESPRRS